MPFWAVALLTIVVLAAVAVVASVIPAGEVAVSPHAPIDLDKRVRLGGNLASPLHGRLAMVGASEQDVSLLQSILYRFDPRVTLTHEPSDPTSNSQVAIELDAMKQSKHVAAAVAMSLLGRSVDITGKGAQVAGILKRGPAYKALQIGDIIVTVDGAKIGTSRDLSNIVDVKPPGSIVSLGLRRNRLPILVKLKTEAPPKGSGDGQRSIIGVLAQTVQLKIGLPETVSIETKRIGGPSAGLAFALAVYSADSGDDLLQGRYVVATGELALDGEVLAVGDVRQKAIAAQDAGYDLMLVPKDNVQTALTAIKDVCKYKPASGKCLHVVSVNSVSEAVDFLKETPAELAQKYAH